MENDVAEVEEVLPCSCDVKLHSLMCKDLEKFLDRIAWVFPAIESARPGCNSGIQELCALNRAIEKGKLLLQHCAESSKLYLAITGQATLLRFERMQKALDLSLSKIQTMVQQPLAAQISDIVNDLRDVTFVMESSEEEAGRLLITLFQEDGCTTDSAEASELEVFQIAAEMLDITSSKALLIEKRSIKKLLDRVHHTDRRKQSVLKYLLYLLKKYGRFVGSKHSENVSERLKVCLTKMNSKCNKSLPGNQFEQREPRLRVSSGHGEIQMSTSEPETPEEFICPISSKLMFDPVVIASGQTCERIWIEKWFNEGHTTCPKTLKQLPHLSMTPNSCLKDLISKWCSKHGITIPDPNSKPAPASFSSCNMSISSSISSLCSSLDGMPILLCRSSYADYVDESDTSNVSISYSDTSNHLDSSHHTSIESLKDSHAQIFSLSDASGSCKSFADFDQEKYLHFFSSLSMLPVESQSKAVRDIKILLKDNDAAYHSMHSNGFVETLTRFLLDAYVQSNINAQRTGLQILLAFISNSRSAITSLQEAEYDMLASFINSEHSKEALEILQMSSSHQCCKPKIVASVALPSIIKIINSQVEEYLIQAVKILSDLSSEVAIESSILDSGCISKLVQLLGDKKIAANCIKILRNLCRTEECRVVIAETYGSIASFAELLDIGSSDECEHAAAILLSLCSFRPEYCHLVMNEGVIPALVNASINGNNMTKENAMKLLYLLRDLRHDDSSDRSLTEVGSSSELSPASSHFCKEKQRSSNISAFFKRKINIFSKQHRSLALSSGS